MDKKSPDAFRTISEVAEWLGVPTHVLRFWESRFTQVKPVKRAGGRRYYRPADMELLGGIRKLLHEDGVTIRGVQKLLREQGVKHVSTMSPAIESDELRDDGSSNVVSLDTARDDTVEKSVDIEAPIAPAVPETPIAEPPLADAPEQEAPAGMVDPRPEIPVAPTTQQHVGPTDAVEDAPMPVAGDELRDLGATASQDTPPATGATNVSDPQSTPPSADLAADLATEFPAELHADPTAEIPAESPPNTTEMASEPNAIDPTVDPLEPIPHDGPTIAETLAANATIKDALEADTINTTIPEDLPPMTPDDVVVTADPTPPTGDTPMDLFSFADTAPVEDAPSLPTSIENTVPAHAPEEVAPSVATPNEADGASEPAQSVEETSAPASPPTPADSTPPAATLAPESPVITPPQVNLPPSLDSEPENATLVDAPIAEAPLANFADATVQMPLDDTAPEPIETTDASLPDDRAPEAPIEEATPTPDAPLKAPQAGVMDESSAIPAAQSAPPADMGQAEQPPVMPAELPPAAAAAPTPLPDISHIPADPDLDQLAATAHSPSCAVRDARKNGTNAHLPVLQALADRLDALSVQMTRAGTS